MSISDFTDLANPVTDVSLIVSAIVFTALKSPLEEAGNPASILSIPKRSSCLAISNFSSWLRFTPGDCSPSLNVVSKILICDRRFYILLYFLFVFHGDLYYG